MLGCRTWKRGLRMTHSQPTSSRPESRSTEAALGTARLTTIIASAPGFAEQSLRATLESMPSLDVVGTAAGCLSALQMVRDRQADLVVLDSNLPIEDVREFLRQLEREGLATRSVVLAATSGHVRHALAAGADAALRRDASLRQLSAVLAEFQPAYPAEVQEASSEVP